jgi:hypothetical protein
VTGWYGCRYGPKVQSKHPVSHILPVLLDPDMLEG